MNAINYAISKNRWIKAGRDIDTLGNAGRNLIINSDKIKVSSRNSNTVVETVTDGEYTNVIKASPKVIGDFSYFTAIYDSLSEQPKIGTQATLSLLIRAIDPSGQNKGMNVYYNTGTSNKHMLGITDDYQWLSVTFDVKSESSRFHFYPTDYQSIYLAKAKLEVGGKQTIWTPAPEDINAHTFVADVAELSYRNGINRKEISELSNAITAMGGAI